MVEGLSSDVARALAELGLRPVATRPLRSLRPHKTLAVELAGGETVKVRRYRQPHKPGRLARLHALLGDLPLAPLLGQGDALTIEAWVDGVPLAELPLVPARIELAADLLGRLHTTHAGRRLRPVAPARARARRWLAALSGGGHLDAAVARRLAAQLDEAPVTAAVGLIHTDFCAENLVETPGGGLCSVDNEGLSRGFLDYDLARAWYRWPMPPAAFQLFLTRYARWRPPGAGEPFWRAAAVLRSAFKRLRIAPERLATPLLRLRALAGG